jgi:hypothetical protein
MGLAVITTAGLAATYVSMPLGYWAASHPHQEYGITNLGFLTVDTLDDAGIAAAIGLLLIPFVLLLARWCAATHAALAVRILPETRPHDTQFPDLEEVTHACIHQRARGPAGPAFGPAPDPARRTGRRGSPVGGRGGIG